jgi:YegS/Rv2252/BmrU family lipid kinase
MNNQRTLPFRDSDPIPNPNRHILLIVNPISGRMKTRSGLFDILDELYRKDNAFPAERVTVVLTTHRGHAAELAAAAPDEGYSAVICCGGDGTLNETVSGLLTLPPERRPELGYIPTGSTNDLAASLGLAGPLRRSAALALSSSVLHLDVGRFTPEGDFPPRHFTYIASFGAFTAVSYNTPQAAKNIMGHGAYVLEGVKDLSSLQPRRASFTLANGTHLEGEYVFCAVANTTTAGGLLQLPKESVSLSDGLFEILLIKAPKNGGELNRILTALLTVTPESCPLIEFHHTEAVTVCLEEPTSWSLDGEEASCGSQVTIRCLPGAVSLRACPDL